MKIAYIKEYHPTNGTLYRQRLTVTPSEFSAINKKLKDFYNATENDTKKDHKITSEQMKIFYYCKPLNKNGDTIKNKYFLTLSQVEYIYKFFYKCFNLSRLKYNNTVLCIKG